MDHSPKGGTSQSIGGRQLSRMTALPASDVLVVLCTFPDKANASEVTRIVIEECLAACGNILPAVESIYRWKGNVETSSEVLVVFKTSVTRLNTLISRLQVLHPYEVPEILGIRVEKGSIPYLRWVSESCEG
jgi:periplasmic divalent cation tolerance protein